MSTTVNPNEGESYGQFVRRQFKKNAFGMISVWIVGIIAVFAEMCISQWLARSASRSVCHNGEQSLQRPTGKHYRTIGRSTRLFPMHRAVRISDS